jgi:acyl dehydratase
MTRRRTISEAEIALFAGVAGDFSPLTIDAAHGNSRVAPPALMVAMAVGLGSMDMPVPSVSAWEWLNWKFPREVHAGDTIYARWTLTQKRAPVGGSSTAIVVWRVDVHTADGTLCAEGEVGASVLRKARAQARAEPAAKAPAAEPPAAAASGSAAPRRGRRRRRTPAVDGTKAKAAVAVEAPVQAAPTATPAASERSASGPRRRRRRRSPSSATARNGDAQVASAQAEAPSAPPLVTTAAAQDTANPLTRAIRRLRRP